jgi:hypothetical protein
MTNTEIKTFKQASNEALTNAKTAWHDIQASQAPIDLLKGLFAYRLARKEQGIIEDYKAFKDVVYKQVFGVKGALRDDYRKSAIISKMAAFEFILNAYTHNEARVTIKAPCDITTACNIAFKGYSNFNSILRAIKKSKDKASQDKASQDKASQDKASQDKASQDNGALESSINERYKTFLEVLASDLMQGGDLMLNKVLNATLDFVASETDEYKVLIATALKQFRNRQAQSQAKQGKKAA